MASNSTGTSPFVPLYELTLDDNVFAVLIFLAFPLVSFYGHKLFKYTLCLLGFLATVYVVKLFILDNLVEPFSDTTNMIILFVTGVIGAIICYKIFKFGIFVIGSLAGVLLFSVSHTLIASYAGTQTRFFYYVLQASFGLVGGLLALWQLEGILMVITAFVGGYMFAGSLDHFGLWWQIWDTPSLDPFSGFFSPNISQFTCSQNVCIVLVVLWMLMFLGGLYFQCKKKGEGGEQHPEAMRLGRRSRSAQPGEQDAYGYQRMEGYRY